MGSAGKTTTVGQAANNATTTTTAATTAATAATAAATAVAQADVLETLEDANILKRFKILHLVGSGNYARVYKGVSLNNGRELAIKSINLSKTSENYKQKFLPRELTILRKVTHENVCKIHEILQVADRIFIVMQFCSRGTIADLLQKDGPQNEAVTRHLLAQILDAVAYLHSLDLAHRDLKVENILLDSEYTPKLTDFSYAVFVQRKIPQAQTQTVTNNEQQQQQQGKSSIRQQANNTKSSSAKEAAANKTAIAAVSPATNRTTRASKSLSIRFNDTFCGTLPYLSPEMIRQVSYDGRKTDIWSLGVCLYVILNDRLPFPFEDIKVMLYKQINRDFKFKATIEFSNEVKDLVGQMFEPEFMRRPTCIEVQRHSWFNGPRERPQVT